MLKSLTNRIDYAIETIKKIGEWLYQYRYYIAIALFILCIVFEISGSSIGCWNQFVNSNVTDEGVLLGKSRGVRSDEWAVLTPMTFSQFFDGFHYFSSILRGNQTDVFMVYGLPVLNLMQIFRPFQLGFLFLGMAKGLSFFWYGRLIALFMVTFEFCMLFTKKSKLLSFLGAVMITLAPIMQWWFAVNGIVEIFVFGELAILILHKYMNTESLKRRCLYLLGLVICAGSYIMVLYPAWQIPMAYVFLALAIWVAVENRKNCKINYKDVISIIIAILVFTGCMGYIFMQSRDTIKTVMNTVYPGSRMDVGGGMLKKYVSYAMNPFLPFKESGLEGNPSGNATMFGLFPIGIFLAVYGMIREKKKDLLLINLLILYAFLSIYCLIGFPEILAKLTLLGKSQAKRAILAVGFMDVLILLRSLTIYRKACTRKNALLLSIILTFVIVDLCERFHKEYVDFIMCVAMGIMCLYLFYFAFRYQSKYGKYLLTCGMVFVMIVAGATVNPVRMGIDVVYQSDIIKAVQQIHMEEPGKWMTEEIGFPIANYLLMAGVPVINSTNTYPNREQWQQIDEKKQYEEVYNRYAHIGIKIRKEENDYKEKFQLTNQTDSFDVYLLPEEVKKLEVKYIFTVNDLEKMNTKEVIFEKIYEYNQYKIYKIND